MTVLILNFSTRWR